MAPQKQAVFPQLVDQYDRTISYLRISLTDRCNLRCIYCMPENEDGKHTKTGVRLQHVDLSTYEEILRITEIATQIGIRKIRLTGGEPLLRKEALRFIEKLQSNKNIEELSLTTNGVLLEEYGEQLWQYGVRQLNISLDTLLPKKFLEITKRDLLVQVWRGIQLAEKLGFRIKINVVAINGVNNDEFKKWSRFVNHCPGFLSCAV